VVLRPTATCCPACSGTLEHTGDKLFYCASCCDFFIELDGTVEHYLLNPPERGPRLHVVV
jgi:tRNA(Ile2) C34 agmatinyltransferase TiaS